MMYSVVCFLVLLPLLQASAIIPSISHPKEGKCTAISFKNCLFKDYSDLKGDDLQNAPVQALCGVRPKVASCLSSYLDIDSVFDLADSKLCKNAQVVASVAKQQKLRKNKPYLFDENVEVARPDGVDNEGKAPKTVIGTDDRVQVDPGAPYFEAIPYLGIKWPNGEASRCTAFYINHGSQASLLTAAHCLYNSGKGGYAASVDIIRERSGSSMPYGITTVQGSDLRVPDAWINNGGWTNDWGLILVSGGRWGLALQTMSDSQLNGATIRIAGYPGDKSGYKMWYDSGPVTNVEPKKVYYREDTYGGQSGSPVWAKVPGRTWWNAVGVHAYGLSGGTENSATRITSSVLNQINAWTS